MTLISTALNKLQQAIEQADPTTIDGTQILALSASAVKNLDGGTSFESVVAEAENAQKLNGKTLDEILANEKIAEAENAQKLGGKTLIATVNADGSFNDDGIFKIKEVNGRKTLLGILDADLEIKPTATPFDIFRDGKCVALLEFEGNAEDTGGVYSGTWHGTPNYENGKIGLAASFDGSSLIELPRDVYDASDINYPITISAWVYLKAGETDALVYNTGGTGNGLGFGIRDNKIYGVVQNGDTIDRLSGDTQLENEVWYFLTIVFDSSAKEMKLYVNRELDASKTMSVYPGSRADYPSIGGANCDSNTFYDDGNVHYTKCIIEHIRFFKNRALTDAEVQTLYNEGV